MKAIYFSALEAKFHQRNGKRHLRAGFSEEGNLTLFDVPIEDCRIIENSASCLKFEYGIRTFKFQFKDYVPGLKKISIQIKLFNIFPFYFSTGEISITDQNTVSDAFQLE